MVKYFAQFKSKIVSDKIRNFGKDLRFAKEKIAEEIVTVVADSSTSLLANVGIYRAIADIFCLIATVFRLFKEDKAIQTVVKNLIANIVDDIGTRINESANAIDKVVANPEVGKILTDLQEDFNKITEGQKAADKSMREVQKRAEYERSFNRFFVEKNVDMLEDLSSEVLKGFIEDDRIPSKMKPILSTLLKRVLKEEAEEEKEMEKYREKKEKESKKNSVKNDDNDLQELFKELQKRYGSKAKN